MSYNYILASFGGIEPDERTNLHAETAEHPPYIPLAASGRSVGSVTPGRVARGSWLASFAEARGAVRPVRCIRSDVPRVSALNRDENCAGGGWEPLEDAEFGVGHVRMLRFFEDHFQTLVAWGKEEG